MSATQEEEDINSKRVTVKVTKLVSSDRLTLDVAVTGIVAVAARRDIDAGIVAAALSEVIKRWHSNCCLYLY